MKLKEYEKSALKFYTNNNESKRIVTADGFETDNAAKRMAEEIGLMANWLLWYCAN